MVLAAARLLKWTSSTSLASHRKTTNGENYQKITAKFKFWKRRISVLTLRHSLDKLRFRSLLLHGLQFRHVGCLGEAVVHRSRSDNCLSFRLQLQLLAAVFFGRCCHANVGDGVVAFLLAAQRLHVALLMSKVLFEHSAWNEWRWLTGAS